MSSSRAKRPPSGVSKLVATSSAAARTTSSKVSGGGHARLAILSSRTASSLLLESSPYVAAEAMLGTIVDPRADIYSLGVVLWRALTGRVPFEASLLGSRTALPKLTEL